MQEKFAACEISQAELLRSIKKKEEDKAAKKDKLHNERTNAMAAVGERIMRQIKGLRNYAEDYVDACKALKLDPAVLAPDLVALAKGLATEEKQALEITTMVYVGNLCPAQTIACPVCKRAQYITKAQLEDLKEHYEMANSKTDGDTDAASGA